MTSALFAFASTSKKTSANKKNTKKGKRVQRGNYFLFNHADSATSLECVCL